jgi:hypothetical protein
LDLPREVADHELLDIPVASFDVYVTNGWLEKHWKKLHRPSDPGHLSPWDPS